MVISKILIFTWGGKIGAARNSYGHGLGIKRVLLGNHPFLRFELVFEEAKILTVHLLSNVFSFLLALGFLSNRSTKFSFKLILLE